MKHTMQAPVEKRERVETLDDLAACQRRRVPYPVLYVAGSLPGLSYRRVTQEDHEKEFEKARSDASPAECHKLQKVPAKPR